MRPPRSAVAWSASSRPCRRCPSGGATTPPVPTGAAPRGPEATVTVLGDVAGQLMGRHAEVAGVGIGAPGLVDDDGVLRYAPNLPGVAELPLAAPLQARLGVPVVVENDASCAGWGERE